MPILGATQRSPVGGPRTIRALVGAACLVACTSSCGAPASSPAAAPSPEAICRTEVQPGPSAFRRLTRAEYDATVRDLLGDDSRPASSFPPDEDGLGYPVGATVSPLLAEHYQHAAEAIAARAVAERLDALAPCAGAATEGCAREHVARLARRAYRRPLDEARVDRLMEVYRDGASEGGHPDGIRLALSAMLQSPYFLYRVELGSRPLRGGAVPLTMDERAARLSYFLWGTMPDEALFAAADAGELRTAAQIEAQARRMLADPKARAAVVRFTEHWLELDLEDVGKDEAVHPEWSPELAASMSASSARFVEHVVFESTGTLRELLTARYAFVDERLAPIYGVASPPRGELARVALPPTERAGILTQAALLSHHARSNESSPVRRGHLVRERLFCQPLPPPPDDLMVTPPDPDPSLSTRARYEEHGSNPACVTCHELMDPLGFPFESFDGIGRRRAEENGFAIDPRGAIHGTRSTDGDVADAVALADALAQSPDVTRCFVEQMWRFAFRRTEAPDDDCSIDEAHARFVASGGDVRELMVAIATSDAFLHRAADAPEDPP